MNIQGFQKLTLLDFPGHIACTVFTGGCNLRCPFCHNGGLVLDPCENESFTNEEIFSFLKKRRGVLDGVAVTGGEPLLQKDIKEFLKEVKELGFAVKLDTNGSFPEKLSEIISEKLADYIAMDIKNDFDKYDITCGMENINTEPFKKSIEIIKNSGIPHEFRTTVVKEFHKKDDIVNIAKFLGNTENYFLQAFKTSGQLIQEGLSGFSEEEMLETAELCSSRGAHCEVRGI